MKINQYSAEELLSLEINYEPLISKVLYKGDTLLIKAKPKVGKSCFGQQLAFSLSSGEPFLGAFEVHGSYNVAYVSGEGFIGNWKQRFINMSKMWPYNKDNIDFFECNSIGLHKDDDALALLREMVGRNKKYDVIVFDCLYALMHGGSVNSIDQVPMFVNNVEAIKKQFNAAAIIVHHDSEKVMTDHKGGKHSAHHSTAMGSTFIVGAVTHSYTLIDKGAKKGKPYIVAKLGRERGGWAVKEIEMSMVKTEDDDLGRYGYTLDFDEGSSNYHAIKDYMYKNKTVMDYKVFEQVGLPSSTFYYNIKKLINNGFVKKATNEHNKDYYEWVGGDVKGDV